MRTLSLYICFALFYSCHSWSRSEVITIAVGEWPPFIGSNLPSYGPVAIDIRKVFNKGGLNVEFKWLPWARIFKSVESGEISVSAIWKKTKLREKTVQYADKPLSENDYDYYLVYSSDLDPQWKITRDLINLKFIGAVGHDYSVLEKEGIEITRVKNESIALKNILNRKYDAMLCMRQIIEELLNKHYSQRKNQIKISSFPVEKRSGYLIFSKTKEGKKYKLIFDKLHSESMTQPADS